MNSLILTRAILRTSPDDDVLRRLHALLSASRRIEWQLVAHIAEVDERRLYAREGCSSMFVYCTEVLHLSEHEAYLRIAAGRAGRDHPELLAMLEDGRIHLSGIGKLAPHLTAENRADVLSRATHKTKRAIEVLVAELSPKPDVPSVIRKLPDRSATVPLVRGDEPTARAVVSMPAPTPASDEPASDELGLDRVGDVFVRQPSPRAAVEPLSPGRYKVQFTATEDFCDKIERLKAMLESSVPNGDLARVFEIAVTEALRRREVRRFGKTSRPRKTVDETDTAATHSRYIPLPVRRASYERDEGRCRLVGTNGRRCTSTRDLHFHHRIPWAHGGDRSPTNIGMLCRTHNQYLAEIDYGRAAMESRRKATPAAEEERAKT